MRECPATHARAKVLREDFGDEEKNRETVDALHILTVSRDDELEENKTKVSHAVTLK